MNPDERVQRIERDVDDQGSPSLEDSRWLLAQLRDAQAENERLRVGAQAYRESRIIAESERDALAARLAEVEKERDAARKRGAEISAHMGIVLDERDGARNVLAGLTDIQRDVEAEQRRADAAEAQLAAVEAVRQTMLGSPLEAVRAWAEIDLARVLDAGTVTE